ncbi:MAG: hypothetical protein ACHQ2Y_01825 [Candidatus Lutacidiplasmatales archaeon]
MPHSRAASGLAGATSMGVALILSLTQLAYAAQPASVTLTAPYKHTHTDRAYGLSLAGCAKGKVTKLPFFLQKNGTAGFSDVAATARCSLPGDNAVSAQSSLIVMVPISFSGNGSHSVVANWHFNATLKATARLGTCVLNLSATISYCLQVVQSYLDEYATLYDATSGATSYPTNFWVGVSNASIAENEHTSVFFNYSSSNPGTTRVDQTIANWFNVTGVVSTDHYWLIMTLSGAAESEFRTLHATLLGGGIGHAELNFATLGRGAILRSIIVS